MNWAADDNDITVTVECQITTYNCLSYSYAITSDWN